MSKFEKVVYAICILFMIWIAASYINTMSHNMTDYNYAWWNVFSMFCGVEVV